MQDGKMSKTRKGDREIISVSLPLEVFDKMEELCDRYHMNRSALIAFAIARYLESLGLRVGER